VNDLFSSNHVAMSIEGPWFRAMVGEKRPGKDFYTVPVPVPDDMIEQYNTAPTLQDMVMVPISALSKNPGAAWEFAKFLRNEEADIAWILDDIGGVATTLRALNSPEAAKKQDLAVYRHELQYARPWPPHPGIIAIANNVFAPYGQKAVVGELSPEAALEMAAAEAQKILESEK
jgi:ABC-type glycerol-3-phosphate transport system substrate-binding protein